MYAPELLDHFQNPRNSGVLEGATLDVEVVNPACGDQLRLAVILDGQRITQVAFQARGCTAAIATASALTTLIEKQTIAEASGIQTGDLIQAVGELPPESQHAAALALDALKTLLKHAPVK